jgi:hypothetical protein
MTLFGKILVVLTTAVSLLLAAWAFGVYTRHLQWSMDTNKSANETVLQVQRLQERLTPKGGSGLWADLTASEQHWSGSNKRLVTIEPKRPFNQKWFDNHLTELTKSANPVKRPKYKNGAVEVIETVQNFGLPVMEDATDKIGQPLKGLDFYRKDYEDRQQVIKVTMEKLADAIKKDEQLTEQIGGPNGLRVQIAREVDKRQRVLSEQEYLKPLLVNSVIEGELLQKRQAALEARVKELRAVGVALSR